MSTAIDDLRSMLDERHVKWRTDTSVTNKVEWTIWKSPWFKEVWAKEVDGSISIFNCSMTPEQAVEATLGRGTCHAIISDNLIESEGMGDAWADCSECGHLLFVLTDPNSEPPNFRPNCGRKVVDG